MRRFKQFLPVLGTLLVLALGAAMPRLALLAMDGRMEQETTQLTNTGISLTLTQEADLFRALALFGGSHTQVELPEGARMTAREAEDAAAEVLAQIRAWSMVYTDLQAVPVLLTSRDAPGLSGVFWRVIWHGPTGAQETLWLDDQTGQMVAFAGAVSGSSTVWVEDRETAVEEFLIFPQAVWNAAEFCRVHYPVDEVKLGRETDGWADGNFRLTLLRTRDGVQETAAVRLRLREGKLDFNV